MFNSTFSNESVFYGIFTFRRSNSFDSALCQFRISNVESALRSEFKNPDNKNFKYSKPMDSCSELTNDEYNKEVAKHFLFQTEQTVNEPALFALSGVRFTAIAVDMANANNNYNDVIFIGTEKGKVLKLLLKPSDSQATNSLQPILVQEIEVFNEAPVNSLIIHRSKEATKLIAISDEQIKSVLLESLCTKYASCQECAKNQDPYCAWSSSEAKCLSVTKQGASNEVFNCEPYSSNDESAANDPFQTDSG